MPLFINHLRILICYKLWSLLCILINMWNFAFVFNALQLVLAFWSVGLVDNISSTIAGALAERRGATCPALSLVALGCHRFLISCWTGSLQSMFGIFQRIYWGLPHETFLAVVAFTVLRRNRFIRSWTYSLYFLLKVRRLTNLVELLNILPIRFRIFFLELLDDFLQWELALTFFTQIVDEMFITRNSENVIDHLSKIRIVLFFLLARLAFIALVAHWRHGILWTYRIFFGSSITITKHFRK